jgi:hypothetical protein
MSHKIWIVGGHYKGDLAFFYEKDAYRASRGRGEWGSDGLISTMQVYESFDLYEAERLTKARSDALAKLTAEEKLLLGIEE